MHIEQVEQLKKEALSGKMNDATELREHICKVIDRTVQATLTAVVDAVPEEKEVLQVEEEKYRDEYAGHNLCRSKILENLTQLKNNL